jgi:hypothetical protein
MQPTITLFHLEVFFCHTIFKNRKKTYENFLEWLDPKTIEPQNHTIVLKANFL